MTPSPHAAWPSSARVVRAAGARHGRKRDWRQTGTRLATMITAIALASALAILFLNVAHRDPQHAMPAAALLEQLDIAAGTLGLGLDQIEVSGARFTSDAEILDAVDLPNVHSFLRLDDAAVRARIERLPWIDTATIERLLPNRLAIRVTERRPFAAWDRGAKDILIDVTGRQLSTVARGAAPELPRIAGEHAPADAARLLALIEAYPDVASRLERAERVAGRRWRLHLTEGQRIELPAEADAAALAMLVEPRAAGRLIDVSASVIDMTVIRRITVRSPMSSKRK